MVIIKTEIAGIFGTDFELGYKFCTQKLFVKKVPNVGSGTSLNSIANVVI